MKRRAKKQAKRKAIYKVIWVSKWKGPTPTIDGQTKKTAGLLPTMDLSSPPAETSTSYLAAKPYHYPVDPTSATVSEIPQTAKSGVSQHADVDLLGGVKSTQSPDSASNWVTVLPKKMKELSSNSTPENISSFIRRKLQLLSKSGKCFKCLASGHLSKVCTSVQKCIGCERKGHFLNACPMLRTPTFETLTDSHEKTYSPAPSLNPPVSNASPPSQLPTTESLSSSVGNSFLSVRDNMAQPPPPVVPENPVDNSWAAMHPIHPLNLPIIGDNWEQIHFPSADEFIHHRPDRVDVYLPPMEDPVGSHVRDISKAIHLTFHNGYPLEGDISHYLSTKFAQRYRGRISDFRVALLDALGSQYVVVVRSGDFRNQICRTPSFDISTPTYAGPVILRPWTRASGGYIERPSHLLKVRLEGAPLHLWSHDFIQYICSSFGSVMRIGDRTRFHSFRVLLMGKHPALVPRELMLSQDPAVKFADVILEG